MGTISDKCDALDEAPVTRRRRNGCCDEAPGPSLQATAPADIYFWDTCQTTVAPASVVSCTIGGDALLESSMDTALSLGGFASPDASLFGDSIFSSSTMDGLRHSIAVTQARAPYPTTGRKNATTFGSPSLSATLIDCTGDADADAAPVLTGLRRARDVEVECFGPAAKRHPQSDPTDRRSKQRPPMHVKD